MAGLREMALGITSALRIMEEPLRVQLRGQSPDEAVFLLKSVLEECVDADIRVYRVDVDPVIFSRLNRSQGGHDKGLSVEADKELNSEIVFHKAHR